ncbi:MAG TPA: hypothetical protein PK453_13660 [Leptospiraceae bacterium]|nr:hypothetical protein [Leptospiraceae bacterium]
MKKNDECMIDLQEFSINFSYHTEEYSEIPGQSEKLMYSCGK